MDKYYKNFVYIFISCFGLIGVCFGYQQQGFSGNQEGLDGIFALVDPELSINGDDLGDVGKTGLGTLDSSFFEKFKLTLAGYLGLDLGTGNSLLLSIFCSFWDNGERIYGLSPCWRWGYLVFYFYHGFLLILICVLLLNRGAQEKLKILFYIGLFLTIGFVNMYEDLIMLKIGIPGFKKDMTYFKLLDYYGFVDKVRNELDLDFNKKNDCKILIEYGTDFWIDMFGPVDIYFKPCELALTGDLVDYKIYYKKEIPEWDLDKKVLLEFNGSYLLENNSN